ncbi:hypothetical protein AB0G67_48235 [Streptomyces sp. NPDC021056]|uniref:hypothetical protein n=1 Tax=Streptomyces sp. NPDC021056 TaxID=3155012 RepID=UPI0033C91E1A
MAFFGWRRGEASTWPARAAAWLRAGEISFVREADRWTVSEVSNQSTGYCLDVTSWTEVSRALDAAELGRPSGFTHEVVFRLCPNCQEHNIVREDAFVCAAVSARSSTEATSSTDASPKLTSPCRHHGNKVSNHSRRAGVAVSPDA